MAQPASAEEIYDRLQADVALMAGLGTYTFRAGQDSEQALPAMRILSRAQRLQEGTIVEGVEVAILRVPEPYPEVLQTGETILNPTWRLYVSQWTDGAGLYEAWPVAQRVIANLPGATFTPVEVRSVEELNDLGILDQFAIRWVDPTAHVTAPLSIL